MLDRRRSEGAVMAAQTSQATILMSSEEWVRPYKEEKEKKEAGHS